MTLSKYRRNINHSYNLLATPCLFSIPVASHKKGCVDFQPTFPFPLYAQRREGEQA